MRYQQRPVTSVVFLDLILNALLCFIALFILAYVQISPRSENEPAVGTEGKYMVVMRWPDGSNDDIDLYVMNPAGSVAYFRSREIGLMHLEHDDLGARSDSVTAPGGVIKVEKNEERTIVRGIIPGEYTANVHMYRKDDPGPTAVTVILYRLIGSDTEIARSEHVLQRNGDEQTAFRFVVDESGAITSMSDTPRRIAGGLLDGGGP